MIRKFASELDSWLQAALEDLPENLRAVKIDCNYRLLTIVNNKDGDLKFKIFWGAFSGAAFLSHVTATKFPKSTLWDGTISFA